MDEKELKSWVSGQLHSLLGFSESHVASFIMAVAKKHSSADSLAVALRQQGLPAGAETQAFASALLARLPRKGAAGNGAHAAQARQAKALIKKNATYGLLEEDESEVAAREAAAAKAAKEAAAAAAREAKEQQQQQRRQLRTRRETSAEPEGEEGGGAALPKSKKQRRAWEEDEEEDEASRRERLDDEARERDRR